MEPETPPSTTDESAASGSSSSSKKRARDEIEMEYSVWDDDDIIATKVAKLAVVTHSLEPDAPFILYYNEQCNLQKAKASHLIQKLNVAGVEMFINPAEEARKGSFVIKMELESGNRGGIDIRIWRVT